MKKKYIRIGAIIAGIFILLILIANLGINFWLKNQLPNYIKNNSAYRVSYHTLEVNPLTGAIFSTGISVNNKNPQNQNVIGVQGTIDTLSISRFGIYDAVFSKRVNSENLMLKNPHLNIILAKPVDSKTGKKRNPVVFKNIKINKGEIAVFRHTKQKMFAVNNLDLNVENLQMTEEAVEKKLPVVFDNYEISGKNFYYRPDNVYIFKADYVNTHTGEMSVKNFKLIPLLSHKNFVRYFPKKSNLIDFQADEMEFKDIVLKKNKISLTNVRFENPDFNMFLTPAKKDRKKNPFQYDVLLKNVLFNNAKVSVINPDESPKFSAGNLNVYVNELIMNEETVRGNIPFSWQRYKLDGKQIGIFTGTENIRIGTFAMNNYSADIRNIAAKRKVPVSDKMLADVAVNHLNLKINEWKFVENKLKLDLNKILIEGVKGNITAPKHKNKSGKPLSSSIQFPLTVKSIELKNTDLQYQTADKPFAIHGFNGQILNVEMNAETAQKPFPFTVGNYTFRSRAILYQPNRFYRITTGNISIVNDRIDISAFKMKPLVSRGEFIRMIPVEKDLYDLSASKILAVGKYDLSEGKKFIRLSEVDIVDANAVIFRSKTPADDPKEKLLYPKLLRSIKFPVLVNNLNIKNSVLQYEEDKPDNNGPGKLIFTDFNMAVKNLNSGKNVNSSVVPININCRFMNASPMNVKWSFDVNDKADGFTIAGNIADLPAERINPFITPYMNVKASGFIQDLIFNFRGNYVGLNGSLNMKHRDLKVEILNKNTKEKNGLLTAIANLVVKTNSGSYPESVVVDQVKRDPSKSFFNLFWKGIQEGLKKTLIGKNVEKTEKTIKDTKQAIDKSKENSAPAQNTEVKTSEKPKENKKSGFFNRIFKKKKEN